MKKILKGIRNPKSAFLYLLKFKISRLLTDSMYTRIKYYLKVGKKLNLENPQMFNEKLQWLKLNDRNNLYTTLVDKYEVREYIEKTIGSEHLVPLYGVFDSPKNINFDELPEQFVLKANHTSGDFFICKNKNEINQEELLKLLNSWMKREYFWVQREWPYKNVVPKIICEQLLVQDDTEELRDYRVFCFHGEPKFIAIDFSINDKNKVRRNLYDLEWNLLDAQISYPQELEIKINKPEKLDEMLNFSREISRDLPHSRIDFYYIKGHIYFGEITFYHQAGFGMITPPEFDQKLGEWIKINNE